MFQELVEFDDDHMYTEKDWQDMSTYENRAYYYSKAVAEKKAWDMVKEFQKNGSKMTLVTINPAFVLGAPTSSRSDSTSVNYLRGLFTGHSKEIKKSLLKY